MWVLPDQLDDSSRRLDAPRTALELAGRTAPSVTALVDGDRQKRAAAKQPGEAIAGRAGDQLRRHAVIPSTAAPAMHPTSSARRLPVMLWIAANVTTRVALGENLLQAPRRW